MNHMNWFSALAIIGGLIYPNVGFADDAALLSRISTLERQVEVLTSALGAQKIEPSLGAPALSEEDQHIQEVVNNTYPWMKGLKLSGDLRLRMENFYVDEAPGRVGRNRFRMRLRYGAEKNIGDDWRVAFRLATGARDTQISASEVAGSSAVNLALNDDPTSTNQTFTDKFNLKDIFVENAYANYRPSQLKGKGPLRYFEWQGGKMPLPWKDYSTSIVWDGDVTPEGMYEKMEIGLYEGTGRIQDVALTGMLGQWLLNETASAHGDQEMYSYTGSLDTKVNVGLVDPATIRNAVNFYDYVDLQDNILIGSTNLARGNDVSGSKLITEDWNILQFYNEIKFKNSWIMNKDLAVFSDWALNTNGTKNQALVFSAPLAQIYTDERNAYSFGAKLGSVKKKKDWEFGYQHFRIERNSVPGIFTESDLGNGHANHRGEKIYAGYGLTDNLVLNIAGWFVHDLSNETGTGKTNRFQTDLVWKF